ncbi:unnamed protein product [Polarella glacialis]|uniref:Pentacotripeptide-repeat region of PRORP domain-containing protein n=1 Tax=Polarella glacialis TaxID=89957 RepID=A0A813JXD5_POLGL|nr:unnamed protein product [Polarella glacialis]
MAKLQRLQRAPLALILLACSCCRSQPRSFSVQRPLDQERERSGNQQHIAAVSNPANDDMKDLPIKERRIITEISQAGRDRDWPRAKAAYVRSSGKARNVYNAAMVAAGQCKEHSAGVAIYNRLCNAGLPKSLVTYGAALKLFSKLDRQDEVNDIIKEIWENVQPDEPLLGAMIDAAAESGKVNEAIELLDKMRSQRLAPTARHWGSAINACKNAGNSTVARFLLDFMIKDGVAPTVIVFNNAVCAHSGAELRRLQKLRTDMVQMGIKADVAFVENYVAAVSGRLVSSRTAAAAADELSLIDPERLKDIALVIAEARADKIRLTGLVKTIEGALRGIGFA